MSHDLDEQLANKIKQTQNARGQMHIIRERGTFNLISGI